MEESGYLVSGGGPTEVVGHKAGAITNESLNSFDFLQQHRVPQTQRQNADYGISMGLWCTKRGI